MNVYLLRHGIAVARDDPATEPAAERPLTAKGAKRMRKAARGLRRLNISFSAVLSSPVIRARQTAEIIAETLGLESQLEEIAGLAPESSVDDLLCGLTRFPDRDHLLLVGHEPLLSHAASVLLGGKNGREVKLELKKGGLCRIEIDAFPPTTAGTLHWLLTPKQLRLLARQKA
jgi:phosphohistidine phosphatase